MVAVAGERLDRNVTVGVHALDHDRRLVRAWIRRGRIADQGIVLFLVVLFHDVEARLGCSATDRRNDGDGTSQTESEDLFRTNVLRSRLGCFAWSATGKPAAGEISPIRTHGGLRRHSQEP